MTALLLGLYAAGVAVGLAVMRDPWLPRIGTALVWPLGPVAFVLVVTILLAAAAALWPVTILGGALVLAALAWLVR